MTQTKKKIYYWAPFLVNIATPKAVINSAQSINRYSKNFNAYIINFFNEFDYYIKQYFINENYFLNFYKINFLKYLPKFGKIQSRFSFIIIFLMSIFPLHSLLKKKKPDFLIIHLITSLPLILLILFKYETKFILRISGNPRLGILRKLLWFMAFKKIHKVTCPTRNTYLYIKSLNIIPDNKICILYDPVISVKKINQCKRKEKILDKDFYLAVGRLTKQKNFLFLIKCFLKLIQKDLNIKLYIIGEGEDYYKIKNFIKKNRIENNIFIIGYKENVYPYYVAAKGFILSSLWEDPGFVLIEAGFSRLPIFSSNSKPGPSELITDNFNGVSFESNNGLSFVEKFSFFKNNLSNKKLLINNLRFLKRFTIFNHYKQISKIII